MELDKYKDLYWSLLNWMDTGFASYFSLISHERLQEIQRLRKREYNRYNSIKTNEKIKLTRTQKTVFSGFYMSTVSLCHFSGQNFLFVMILI